MINSEFARKLRILTLKMVYKGRSSHIGSIFSAAEIISVLFNEILNIDPKSPSNPDRDRFILSKGMRGLEFMLA